MLEAWERERYFTAKSETVAKAGRIILTEDSVCEWRACTWGHRFNKLLKDIIVKARHAGWDTIAPMCPRDCHGHSH